MTDMEIEDMLKNYDPSVKEETRDIVKARYAQSYGIKKNKILTIRIPLYKAAVAVIISAGLSFFTGKIIFGKESPETELTVKERINIIEEHEIDNAIALNDIL